MRISDWSSDVCSSDLPVLRRPPETEPPPGRPFRPATALVFALMLAAILFASAALQAWLGEAGLLLATFLSGFADTHAPAISAAALAGSGPMAPPGAVLPGIGRASCRERVCAYG